VPLVLLIVPVLQSCYEPTLELSGKTETIAGLEHLIQNIKEQYVGYCLWVGFDVCVHTSVRTYDSPQARQTSQSQQEHDQTTHLLQSELELTQKECGRFQSTASQAQTLESEQEKLRQVLIKFSHQMFKE
jgi:phenylalanyl-tRNA synthetase alpha subunit